MPMYLTCVPSSRNYSSFNNKVATFSGRRCCQATSTQGMTTNTLRGTEWLSKTIELPGLSRGCHVITRQIYDSVPEISEFEIGLANFFIQHTSASLTVNENASPDVPLDLADALDTIAPEGTKVSYRHDDEGPDDMPAHIKSSLMGPSLNIPISHGRLAMAPGRAFI